MPAQPATPPPPCFPDEVERLEAAQELEYLLGPLAVRCDALEAAPALPPADQLLLDQLSAFIASVGRYDAASERLLEAYRHALAHAERPLPAPVPSLEQAIAAADAAPAWTHNPTPTPAELLAEREADPVYRLGFVRGHAKGVAETERRYQTVVRLYAQHAVLVPPAGYQPTPLIIRLKKWVATRLMSGPRWPAPTRQLLLAQTATLSPLTPHGPQR